MEGMVLDSKILYVGQNESIRSTVENRLGKSPFNFEIIQTPPIESLDSLLDNDEYVGVITDSPVSNGRFVQNICDTCQEREICAVVILVAKDNEKRNQQIPVTEPDSLFIITNQSKLCDAALKATDIIISHIMPEKGLPLHTGLSRDYFRIIFENSRVGITLVGLDDRIIEVNPEFQQMVGYSEEELKDVTITEIIHPDDISKDYSLLERMLSENEDRYQMERRYIAKDGEIVWANLTVTVVRDDNGKPLWTIGIVQDITKQKKAQQVLRKQKEELSDFAHEMSHDLSNRLHQVNGYLDLYHENHDEEMYERAQHILLDMGNLLKYSVELADAGQIVRKESDIDLNEVVMDVATTIIPRCMEYTQDELPSVPADRTKLLQVFRNIFDNALEHGNPDNIEVKKRMTEDGMHLQIMNDGEPIPSEHASNLFKRGFTTRPSSTGFGLTITKKIVKAHGWEISLASTDPPIFDIFIPRNSLD